MGNALINISQMSPFQVTFSNTSGKVIYITGMSQPIVLWPLAVKYKAGFVIEVDNFFFSLCISKPLNLPFDKDLWYLWLFPVWKALLQTVPTTIITWQWHEVLLVCELACGQIVGKHCSIWAQALQGQILQMREEQGWQLSTELETL